jgi:hypothetical protein
MKPSEVPPWLTRRRLIKTKMQELDVHVPQTAECIRIEVGLVFAEADDDVLDVVYAVESQQLDVEEACAHHVRVPEELRDGARAVEDQGRGKVFTDDSMALEAEPAAGEEQGESGWVGESRGDVRPGGDDCAEFGLGKVDAVAGAVVGDVEDKFY